LIINLSNFGEVSNDIIITLEVLIFTGYKILAHSLDHGKNAMVLYHEKMPLYYSEKLKKLKRKIRN
jgi:hypothetical protein